MLLVLAVKTILYINTIQCYFTNYYTPSILICFELLLHFFTLITHICIILYLILNLIILLCSSVKYLYETKNYFCLQRKKLVLKSHVFEFILKTS